MALVSQRTYNEIQEAQERLKEQAKKDMYFTAQSVLLTREEEKGSLEEAYRSLHEMYTTVAKRFNDPHWLEKRDMLDQAYQDIVTLRRECKAERERFARYMADVATGTKWIKVEFGGF